MPRLPPPEVLKSWPQPNLVNPETRSPLPLLILCATMGSVALAGTTLRVYYRAREKKLGIEDWVLMVSLVFSLGLSTMCCWAYYHAAWGAHTWDLVYSIPLIQKLLKCILAAKILHQVSVATCRISVLLFYTRLLNKGYAMGRWWVWAQRGGIVLTIVGGLVFILTSIFQCLPVAAYWVIFWSGTKTCLHEGAVCFFFGIYNIFMDVYTFSLPIPVVLQLKMPLHERISVIAILCLGFFATICSVFKAYYIYMALIGSWDQTWYTMPLWISATVENNLLIICACVPILNKPLLSSPFQRLAKRMGLSRRTGSYAYHSSGRNNSGHKRDLSRNAGSNAFHSQRTNSHAYSIRPADVSVISKSDKEALPMHGIIVTREIGSEFHDRDGEV